MFAPKHPEHEFTRIIYEVVGANRLRVFVSQSLFLKLNKPSIPPRPKTVHDEDHDKLCQEDASSGGDGNEFTPTSSNSSSNNPIISTIKIFIVKCIMTIMPHLTVV